MYLKVLMMLLQDETCVLIFSSYPFIMTKFRQKYQMAHFLAGSEVKNPPASAGDMGSISGSGRFPGKVNGNSLQYSCLENPMDRETYQAMVPRVTKSWTQLK